MVDDISIRPFEPGDERAFRELNEAWIAEYFEVEPKDREVLGDPATHILDRGGHILMAVKGSNTVGCCALALMEAGCFEVAKMTIAAEARGLGLGRRLLIHVIGYAKDLGATRLYLETNRKLAPAIRLYESLGFREIPQERVHPSPYARSNVHMELTL